MGKKYYIADMHFGHRDILLFDERPYENLGEMHEIMTMNWDFIVREDDDVYILGDFAMHMRGEEAAKLAGRLSGRKHLIRGNHDRKRAGWYENVFEDVADYAEIHDAAFEKDVHVCMSHYFIPFYNRARYGAVMLHGHTHKTSDSVAEERMKQSLRDSGIRCEAYNVGCMWQNYMPQTLEQIIQRQERKIQII